MFHRLYGANILFVRTPPKSQYDIISKKIDVFKYLGLDTNIQCLCMYLSD